MNRRGFLIPGPMAEAQLATGQKDIEGRYGAALANYRICEFLGCRYRAHQDLSVCIYHAPRQRKKHAS